MKKALLLLLLLPLVSFAQVRVQIAGDGPPTGYCNLSRYLDTSNGNVYICDDTTHTWGSASQAIRSAVNISTDSTHRFATDAEKSTWNGKQDALGFTPANAANLGGAASLNVGTAASTVAAGDDSRITGAAQKSANLSDLASASTARTNLGLGSLATQSGTFSGTSSGTNTGDQTNISGNAATVTTNANLTGDVTSVGNATTIGSGKVTNAMLAGSIAYGKLSLTGAVLNADLAGSIDLATKVTGSLPYANGGFTGSAATSATTGTMTVTMNTRIVTITPTGACTFNASGGIQGQTSTFVVTTSGTSSFTLTFGTNFKSVGTLATGTTSGKIFTVTFLNTNGSQWVEMSRTAAQ